MGGHRHEQERDCQDAYLRSFVHFDISVLPIEIELEI